MAAADVDTSGEAIVGTDFVPAGAPAWFSEPHGHDRYKYFRNKKVKTNERPGRPTPATVILSWKPSANRQPVIFGSFNQTASICRARPSFMSQHMSFYIELREGQDHGPKSTEARVRDKLLFDPSNAKRMTVEIVGKLPDDIFALLGQVNVGANPENHSYAIIRYTMGKEPPVWDFDQRARFTPGSAQAAFQAEKPRYYTVVCKPTTVPHQTAWQTYNELFNGVRCLSVNDLPTADWYYSHDPNYSKNYTPYISDVDIPLPNLSWLRTENGTYRAVYPTGEDLAVDDNTLPVGVFASVGEYCRHYIPAVLKDREEDMRQELRAHPYRVVRVWE